MIVRTTNLTPSDETQGSDELEQARIELAKASILIMKITRTCPSCGTTNTYHRRAQRKTCSNADCPSHAIEAAQKAKETKEIAERQKKRRRELEVASSVKNEGMNMNRISQGVVVGFGLAVLVGMGVFFALISSASPNYGNPKIYELTRQTAENTRNIYVLLFASFMALFGFYLPYYAHKEMY